MTSAFDGGYLLAFITNLPADVVLITFAGFMSLSTGVAFFRTAHAQTYRYFALGQDGYDVTSVSLLLMIALGCTQLILAFVRIRGLCRLTINKYIVILLIILMTHFLVGITLSNFKTKIPDSLEAAMKPKLRESIIAQRSLGVGFRQSDAWDLLQTRMLCCGVLSYQDYLQDRILAKDQTIPVSCCVMKGSLVPDGEQIPVNPSQCLLDASHRVRHSVFLHVQGCMSPLSRWLIHYISRITTLIFGSVCLQASTLLYLSWQGYQRPHAAPWR